MRSDINGRIKDLKKEHDVEIITLKKNARIANIEFFKEKSEKVMRVFKQEQMHIVEEFYNLKQRDLKKELIIYKQNKIINEQERIINEHTCFIHDCMDRIFAKALEKAPEVCKSMRKLGLRVDRTVRSDPFKLYQGYIELVKPIEIETSII